MCTGGWGCTCVPVAARRKLGPLCTVFGSLPPRCSPPPKATPQSEEYCTPGRRPRASGTARVLPARRLSSRQLSPKEAQARVHPHLEKRFCKDRGSAADLVVPLERLWERLGSTLDHNKQQSKLVTHQQRSDLVLRLRQINVGCEPGSPGAGPGRVLRGDPEDGQRRGTLSYSPCTAPLPLRGEFMMLLHSGSFCCPTAPPFSFRRPNRSL